MFLRPECFPITVCYLAAGSAAFPGLFFFFLVMEEIALYVSGLFVQLGVP